MKRTTWTAIPTLVLLLSALSPATADEWRGSIGLGAVSLDEEYGSRAISAETFNIEDGFSVSRIWLEGRLDEKKTFTLDLGDINLDSRRGLARYSVAGLGNISAGYDEHRQIFSADGAVASERRDWRFAARIDPAPDWRIKADYNIQTREGDRLSYPAGAESALAGAYDHVINRGDLEVAFNRDGRGVALGFERTELTDNLRAEADRSGHLVSLRAHSPCLFLRPGLLTHYVRGAVGTQEITGGDLDYTLKSAQYVGVARPAKAWQVKYTFDATRIDDSSTELKTNRVRNDLDLGYFHGHGRIFGGVGYVTHDDDRSLTSYETWRLGTSAHWGRDLRARVSYASSNKNVDEQITLLQDVEDQRLQASLRYRPRPDLTLGVSFKDRQRAFPVLDVESDGTTASAVARLEVAGWGAFEADYTYTNEEYEDPRETFEVRNHFTSGRAVLTRVTNLELSAGATYLDIGGDLDIEKSILSFGGTYRFAEDYRLEVHYNVHNYDDYLLLDRYYTANVLRVNVVYDLAL